LVERLHRAGVRILGTHADMIDAAEDRAKASTVLAGAGVPAPTWTAVERWDDLREAAENLGCPVLLRPSYVLSGRGMTIARSSADLVRYLKQHSGRPLASPLLIDHFLEGAIELNVDAVCDGHDVVSVVMEQLDECGIHSGD